MPLSIFGSNFVAHCIHSLPFFQTDYKGKGKGAPPTPKPSPKPSEYIDSFGFLSFERFLSLMYICLLCFPFQPTSPRTNRPPSPPPSRLPNLLRSQVSIVSFSLRSLYVFSLCNSLLTQLILAFPSSLQTDLQADLQADL